MVDDDAPSMRLENQNSYTLGPSVLPTNAFIIMNLMITINYELL